MFSTTDTIVAIATPPGRGGIGVVRLSGPDAHAIAKQLMAHRGALEPRRATLTTLRLPAAPANRLQPPPIRANSAMTAGRGVAVAIDRVVATYFPAPASYTGNDVVEVSAHGSPVVLRAIVAAAVERGARIAEPGEFTLRAFLNGRMDLLQAEAVADLIEAATPLQARAAFDQLDGTLTRRITAVDAALFDLIARLEASVDFPGENFHFVDRDALVQALDGLLLETATLVRSGRSGRLIREGLHVAIVGAPNVGKSSLFNALVGASRAIVTETPGTTRDLVSEVVDIQGLCVTLTDTAGLRDSTDRVEAEGVARARQAAAVADLVLEVRDASSETSNGHGTPLQVAENKRLVVMNKSDLSAGITSGHLAVSARTGDGIDRLRASIVVALDVDLTRERPGITNIRHIALVERAHLALARARSAAQGENGGLSEEFVLADLQDARGALEEVTGVRTAEAVLEHIFSRFCIGK